MSTAANPSQAEAVVLVDELARNGVTDAVMSPGSRSTALVVALDDDPRIRLHVALDERSAGFVAVGLGRSSGRPAVVVTTSGSASANLHPAVLESDHGRVPLVVLTADRPPELRGTGANQTIDQVGLFGGSPRLAVDVPVAEDRPGAVERWRDLVSRAVAAADGRTGAAGPVHLNLPFREPTVPVSDDGRSVAEPFGQRLDGRPGGAPWNDVARERLVADEALLAGVAGRILSTERGVVVVGDTGGADVGAAVATFAAAAGWPVIAEPQTGARGGGHVIAHASLLLAGPFAARHRPDLVVRIGRSTVSVALDRWLGPRTPQVVVDRDAAWIEEHRAGGELVVADPDEWLMGVAEQLAVETSSAWLDEWRDADVAADEAISSVVDGESRASEPQVARDVVAAVPRGGQLLVASSMPIRDVDAYARPREELRVLANRGTSGIDGFVGTAVGAALAHDGPTVALLGDLSFLHDRNGLLVSPDAATPSLVLVVVDNDGGGIFHQLPQARHVPAFERLFATPHGLDLAEVARTHRLPYSPVVSAADLLPALQAAADAGGIHLLHVRTVRAQQSELRRRIQQAVAAVT